MKALSLWQPWASQIAFEEKLIETRSWDTYFRGRLAIHAAKQQGWLGSYPPDQLTFFEHALARMLKHCPDGPPFGAIICVVELLDVVSTELIRDALNPQERAFGDYSDGRYAWKLKLVHRFERPIPYRGRQGLFRCLAPELAPWENAA